MDGTLADLSVAGEITNVRRSRDGWYFSLKDDFSQVDCFCYESADIPVQGKRAVATGAINYYGKTGRLSFFVRKFTVEDASGTAYMRFVRLKEKLEKEGLFAEERKKVVPTGCRTIGVVSSENGAVIHDIEKVALRRQPYCNILLYPVKVQGAGASEELANAINYFSRSSADVVIIARGGGSDEDLSAFNDEAVVRAVSSCLRPTVSAVGHGINYTLTDFAADKCAATPSEAAELVTIDVESAKYRVMKALSRQYTALYARSEGAKKSAVGCVKRISAALNFRTENVLSKVLRSAEKISDGARNLYAERYRRLENYVTKLNAANPANLFSRGFAAVEGEKGKITSISDVACGESVRVILNDGSFGAVITTVEENKK